MSQPGKYRKLGRYRKPEAIESFESYGSNERSSDPLNILARALFDITKNATDVYEIAAHLEAIGYNSYRVKREFGFKNPFELARAIDEVTPKQKTEAHSWQKSINSMWLRQLAILLAILATIALQLKTLPNNWLTIVWLIIWSVIGSKLVNKIQAELSFEDSRSILTVLSAIGFVGLVSVWALRFPSLPEATVNLLWWAITCLFWAESLLQEITYKGLILVAIAFLGVLAIPLEIIITLLFGVTIFFLWPFLNLPNLGSWRWLIKSLKSVTLLIPYGLGIGILLVELFQSHSEHILIAGSILIAMSFSSEWLVIWLRDRLSKSLWLSTSDDEYVSRTNIVSRTILLLLLGSAIVIFVFSLFSNNSELSATVAHFILYGLSLNFALILLTLDNVLFLSLSFLLAIILIFIGLPLSFTVILLPAVLALAIFFALQKMEDYGIHVI